MDRFVADAKARPRSSVLKTPLGYSPYSTYGTHDTHDPRYPTAPAAPHITHSALLFFLFLNRVYLFDRDRPMQSFYRGACGRETNQKVATSPLHPMAGLVKPYWLPHGLPLICAFKHSHRPIDRKNALLHCLVPPVKSPFASPTPHRPSPVRFCPTPSTACRLYARGEGHGKPQTFTT